MKYVCASCKREFMHTAKKIKTLGIPDIKDIPEGKFISIPPRTGWEDTLEFSVCPYCQSLDFDEIPPIETKITSVLSVDLSEVDEKLKEGYVVHELYAKTATLIKKEEAKKD